MGVMEYAFATYVFLLLCTAIWLVSRLIRPRKQKKEQSGHYEKEQRLFNLYQNIEDLLAGFEEYVEEARAENEQMTLKTTTMLEEAKRLCEEIKTLQSHAALEPVNDDKPSDQVISASAVPRASTVVKAAYMAAAAIKAPDTPQDTPDAHQEQPDTATAAVSAVPDMDVQTDISHMPQSIKPIVQKLHMRLPDKVAELRSRGLDPGQIAQQLGISVREVSLAMKIRKAE